VSDERAITPQDLHDIQEENATRLRALAAQGTPIQINGVVEHLLTYMLQKLVGDDGVGECFYLWEQKVSANLDTFEAQMRMQRLVMP
jgi:hypothetical protein